MKLIPHHQDDKYGRRERHEDHADWYCHAAFERRRDALVFLDTTAVTLGGESTAVTAATPKRSETLERSDEPTRVQPAPAAEETDHARHRRNPLRRPPVVAVRRAPVRREADRAGRRAGDLLKMAAIHNGDQLPETPRSDEDCEEDLTGRAVAAASNDRN